MNITQRYQITQIIASSNRPITLPAALVDGLKNSTFHLIPTELIQTLNQLGYHVTGSLNTLTDKSQVGLWIQLEQQPVLLQCQLTSLILH